jgi:hypothetical protein
VSGEPSDKIRAVTEQQAGDPPAQQAQLADLMAAGGASAGPAPRAKVPDLDRQALRAAEAALAEGQKALAAAQAQLGAATVAPAAPAHVPRTRERVLRGLLVFNLLLMAVVVLLPYPQSTHAPGSGDDAQASKETGNEAPTQAPLTSTETPSTAPLPDGKDLYLQALGKAAQGDYRGALALVEQYLTASPHLGPMRRVNVYHAAAYYALQLGDTGLAAEYDRKAEAVTDSHTLPEDLLAMAKDAEQHGDSEALRRLYARFLLQQRQVPASLYEHVAEAYLKLGDSYRMAAQKGAAAAKKQQLEQLRDKLHAQDPVQPERPAGGH